jgi:FAD synthase
MGLSRQQLRNQARQKAKQERQNSTLYTLTKNDIIKTAQKHVSTEVEKIKREALRMAVGDLTAAFVMSLHDEFDWFSNKQHGKARIEKLLTRVSKNFECINQGLITVEDIKAWCEEVGIDYYSVFQEVHNAQEVGEVLQQK